MSLILGAGFGKGSTGAGSFQTREFNYQISVDGQRNAHLVTPMKVGNSKKFTLQVVFKHCDKNFNIVSAFSELNKNFFTTLRFESNKEPNKDYPNRIVFEQKEGSTTIFRVSSDLHSGENSFISVVLQYDSQNINESDRVRIFINTVEQGPIATSIFPAQNRSQYFFSNNSNCSIFGAPGYEYFLQNGLDTLDLRQTGTIAQVTVLNDILARPQDLLVFSTDVYGQKGTIKLKLLNQIVDQKSIDVKFEPTPQVGQAFQENYIGQYSGQNTRPAPNSFNTSVNQTRFFQFITGKDRKFVSSDTLQTQSVEPACVMIQNNSTSKNFEFIYPLNTYETQQMSESFTRDKVYQGYYPFFLQDVSGSYGNKRVMFDSEIFNKGNGYFYNVCGASINKDHGTELVVLNKHGGAANTPTNIAHSLNDMPDAALIFQDSRMIFSDRISKKQSDCSFAKNQENAFQSITQYQNGSINDLIDWDTTDNTTLVIKQSTRFPKIFDDSNTFIAPNSQATVQNIVLDVGTFQLQLASAKYNDLVHDLMQHPSKPSDVVIIRVKKQSRTDQFVYDVLADNGTVKTVQIVATVISYNNITKEFSEQVGTLRYEFNYTTNNQKLEQGTVLLLKNTTGKLNITHFDTTSTGQITHQINCGFIPKFALVINRNGDFPTKLLSEITIDGCRSTDLKYGSEVLTTDGQYTGEKMKIDQTMNQVTLSNLQTNTQYSVIIFADSQTVRNSLVDSNGNSVFNMVNMNGITSLQTDVIKKDFVKFLHPKNYLKMDDLYQPFQNDTSKLCDIDEMGTLIIPNPNKATQVRYMSLKTEKFRLGNDSDTELSKYFEFRKIRDKVNSDQVPDQNWVVTVSTSHNSQNQLKYSHGKMRQISFSQDCFEQIDGSEFTSIQNQYIQDQSVIGVEIYRKKIAVYENGKLRYEKNFQQVLPKDSIVNVTFQTSKGSTMVGSQFNLKASEQELPKFKFNFGTEAFLYNRTAGQDCQDVYVANSSGDIDYNFVNQQQLFDQKLYQGNNSATTVVLDFSPDLVMIREVTQNQNVSPLLAWDQTDNFQKVVPMQYQSVNRVQNPNASTNFGRVQVAGSQITITSGAGTDLVNETGKMYMVFAFKQQDDFFKILKYNGNGAATQVVPTPHKSEFGFIFCDVSTGPKKLKNFFKSQSTQFQTVYESPINGTETFTQDAMNTINASNIVVKDQFNTVGETFTIYQFTTKSGHLMVDIVDNTNNDTETHLNKTHTEQMQCDFKPQLLWCKPFQENEQFYSSVILPGNQRSQLKYRVDNYQNQLVNITDNLTGTQQPQKFAQQMHLSQEGVSYIVQQSQSSAVYMYALFGKPGTRRTLL